MMISNKTNLMTAKRIPRLGIGGPVGSGKTMLIEKIVPLLAAKGYKAGIISNDVVSREDADRMRQIWQRSKAYFQKS